MEIIGKRSLSEKEISLRLFLDMSGGTPMEMIEAVPVQQLLSKLLQYR